VRITITTDKSPWDFTGALTGIVRRKNGMTGQLTLKALRALPDNEAE
jgi:hypothetical protein